MKLKRGMINSIFSVEEGHEYICVILKATNVSDKNAEISANDFFLINSNGEELTPCYPMVKIWEEYDYITGTTLVGGGTKTGILVFNNSNTDNSNLKLKLEEFHWFSDNKVYEINLINN